MTSSQAHPVSFSFESQSLPPETFEVSALSGSEEISRPYRFEIGLIAGDPDIDLEKLLYGPATLTIEKGDGVRKVHGIVSSCRILDALPKERYAYQVVLKPRIWMLSLNRQNQIYQDLSVADIVSQEINGNTAKGASKPAAAGLTRDDFELRLTREYQPREYVVQYDESDLDFISRLMEHEGIFYFFEQGEDKEKLIISDNNIHFADLPDDAEIAYRPKTGMDRSEDEAVLTLSGGTRRIPRKLVLKDYNYRTPHVMLQAEADVDENSHGLMAQYGDHFKSSEEGGIMARIRSQEISCTKQVFTGTADSIHFQSGCRFNLVEHFRESFNAAYVVTRIDHQGRQPLEAAAGVGSADSTAFYGNNFNCIAADVAYRPPRQTPKPRVSGLMNAHVDAALLENRAEIDGHGRYKLIMPFDLSGAAAGKASRYVRKAQPYGGQDMGMHFPLHKGTEVICTFINGDPDRPIITGVVPNPLTASVVTSDNYTKNVVKTAHGSYFEFNDGKGPVDEAKDGAAGNGQLAGQQHQQSTALTSAARVSKDREGRRTDEANRARPQISGLAQQQQRQSLSSAEESGQGADADVWFRVDVPNYNASTTTSTQEASYLRLGKTPDDEKLMARGAFSPDFTLDGGGADSSIPTPNLQFFDEDTYKASRNDLTSLQANYTIGENIKVSCGENVTVTLSPNPTSYTDQVWEKGDDSLVVTLDAASGVITVDIGHDKSGSHTTVVTLRGKDSGADVTKVTTIKWDISENFQEIPPGWYDYTDGDHTSITRGNKEEKVLSEEGDLFKFVTYEGTHKLGPITRKVSLEHTSAFSVAFGDEESYFGGSQIEGFLGLKTEIAVASSLEVYSGVTYETHLDWNFEYGLQGSVNVINGDEYELVDQYEKYATGINLFVLKTDPTPTGLSVAHSVLQALAAVAVGAWAGGRAGAMHRLDNEKNQFFHDIADFGGHAAAAVAHVGMLIASLSWARKIKSWRVDQTNKACQLNMTDTSVELKCGESASLTLNADGTIELSGTKITINGTGDCEVTAGANALVKGVTSAKLDGTAKAELLGTAIAIGGPTSATEVNGTFTNK